MFRARSSAWIRALGFECHLRRRRIPRGHGFKSRRARLFQNFRSFKRLYSEIEQMISNGLILEAFALLLGIGMASRFIGIIWPGQIKQALKAATGRISDANLRWLGAFLIVIGIASFYAIFQGATITRVAATLFAFSLVAGGILLSIPRLARSFWREDFEASDMAMRLLCALTTVIGLAIIYFTLLS